jgi:hypothetical protein
MFIVSACDTHKPVLPQHNDSFQQNVRFNAQPNLAAGGMW